MKKPISYNISPARGQAILNFQGRRFPDKIELFENKLIEEVRLEDKSKSSKKDKQPELNSDFKNLLIHGDCLSACAYVKSQNIKVDLVYIDPPFASGANYAKVIYLHNEGKENLKNKDNAIGEEIMYSDIWQKEDYLNWIYERLLAIKDIMSDNGSIFVHLDATIGHYVKILLDEIFGEINFQREIIWRIGWVSGYKTNTQNFIRNHDLIYYYTNNFDNKIFNKTYIQYPKNYTRRGGLEPTGKGYPLEDTWNCNEIDRLDSIQIMSFSPEKVDYVTQKNENLLKRIIESCSNKDMIVADFFCGSGTAAKVANDMGRKFIACDIGLNAIQTSRDRLIESGAEFDILKINDGVRLFRNPAQTTAKIYSLINGFKNKSELDIGDFWDGGIINKKGNFTPVKFIGIQEKLSKEFIDIILEQVYQLDDESEGVKIIYAHKDFDVSQDYINKEIRNTGKTELKVELISIDELLGQKAEVIFTPDTAIIDITKKDTKYKVEIKKYFSSYLKNKIDDYNNKKVKHLKQQNLSDNTDKSTKSENKKEFIPIKISNNGLELIESVQFDTTIRDDGVWISNPEFEDKAKPKEKIKGVYFIPTNKFKVKIRNIAGDEIIIDSKEILK